MKLSDLPQHQIACAQQFILRSMVPLLRPAGDQTEIFETGTLVEIEERKYIICAAHCFEGIDENLSVPSHPINATDIHAIELRPLKPFTTHHPDDDKIDVGIIDVTDSWIGKDSNTQYRFLSTDMVSDRYNVNHFLFFGFPQALIKDTKNTVSLNPIMIMTERLEQTPSNAKLPVTPGLDLFFLHEKSAPMIGGGVGEVPLLHGISGTGIWHFDPYKKGLWSPESALKLCGIQISVLAGTYIRAINWQIIFQMLAKINYSPSE